MSGIRLGNMKASDMLDVLHYLFEEDNSYSSEEQMKSKLHLRETLYENLYHRTYKYKLKNSGTTSRSYVPAEGDDDEEEILAPFNPKERKPTKEYISPTKFNPDAARPFGTILDPPVG